MSKRSTLARSSGLALTLLLLAGCAGGPQEGGPEPSTDLGFPTSDNVASGGEMTIGLGGVPPILDPLMYGTPPTNFIQELLFSSLTRMETKDGTAKLVPGMATSWEQVNPTTWEFQVREGVTFPNGEKLDANAMAFSLNYLRDPENAKANAAHVKTVSGAKATSSTTLVVTTAEPDPLLPNRMVAVYGLPPQDVTDRGAEFFANPIGTGPFEVVNFQPEQLLELQRNENSAYGPPNLERLVLQALPDAGARIAALKAGDVDAINRLTTEQVKSVASAGFTVAYQIENGTYIVTAIQSDGPLSDVRVRQAISMAIDREALNESLLDGLGQPASQFVKPGAIGYCPALKTVKYDPDGAKKLLAEAGYADGFSTKLQASNGYLVNDTTLAEAMQAMLADVGIDATLEIQEFGSFLDSYFDPNQRPGLYAWRNGNQHFLDAESAMTNLSGLNATHKTIFSNSEFDQTLLAVRSELDADKRQKQLCTLAGILRDEAPVIPVLHLPDVWALSDEIVNFPINGSGVPDFADVGFKP